MVIAYFDCFSGIAGDMILGAMVDAGLPLSYLKRELSKLSVGGFEIKLQRQKGPVGGTNLHVITKKELPRSDYTTIRALINRSKLSSEVKLISSAVFERLAEAEGKVHGVPKERAHFHEVGAIDSIVDIIGSAIGFEYFGFDEIYSSPLPMTRGRIRSAHGLLPVPAPATLHLIKGVPLEKAPVRDEIVTPTGAAIITTVAKHFGECPLHKIETLGYGFGDKRFPGIPNALRLMIGEGYPVVVIEANIDDMNPQIFDHVMERLFRAGAVDVMLQPIQMKKNRPAVMLHCQAPWDKKDKVIDVILRETTTMGVRYYPVERKVLKRGFKTVKTRLGKIRMKTAYDNDDKAIKSVPEYEDVIKLARKTGRSVLSILNEIKDR